MLLPADNEVRSDAIVRSLFGVRFPWSYCWLALETEIQPLVGVQMILATAGAFGTAEGWLELERHESDLRGSRGVAIAGGLMLFMGILNFTNTVSVRASASP